MPSSYIENNQSTLEQVYTQLRRYILEERMNLATGDPIQAMISTCTSPEDNPNYGRMVELLQSPVNFNGPQKVINKQNYYVIKYRLTKYTTDIVHNELRAGYMYVLVRKMNDLAVSFFYAHDTQNLLDVSIDVGKEWVKWEHSGEGWIIYDGVGNIRGSLTGSLMES